MEYTIKLNYEEYKDKVYACWIGKNIGGTMGTPYEGVRKVLDIKGFATDPGVVLPNDDLDLQLIWLHALENFGPFGINAKVLGEHWISFIVPHWNEYGNGKINMKRGLQPPISGDYENDWNNSNGAWIRSEIWATVAPAMPHVAAKYAMEDAMVDHGAGEGTFAAAFVSALQSSAFIIKDLKKCIEIGLATIPPDSRMAKSIKLALDYYESGKSWLEARNDVQQLNSDIGDGWFEAPSNVTYAVIGLLWGEGDFKKSMITAINCGDDTDCTGATVGATFGILYGTAGIPKDWREYIGDDIVTISIAKGCNGQRIPKTCTELSERVAAIAPVIVGAHTHHHTSWICKNGKYSGYLGVKFGEVTEAENAYEELLNTAKKVGATTSALKPYSIYEENVMYVAQITLDGAPEIKEGGEIKVHLQLKPKLYFENEQRTMQIRWILPEGFTAKGKLSLMAKSATAHSDGTVDADYVIKAPDVIAPENRVILEIIINGRCTPMYISFPLFG